MSEKYLFAALPVLLFHFMWSYCARVGFYPSKYPMAHSSTVSYDLSALPVGEIEVDLINMCGHASWILLWFSLNQVRKLVFAPEHATVIHITPELAYEGLKAAENACTLSICCTKTSTQSQGDAQSQDDQKDETQGRLERYRESGLFSLAAVCLTTLAIIVVEIVLLSVGDHYGGDLFWFDLFEVACNFLTPILFLLYFYLEARLPSCCCKVQIKFWIFGSIMATIVAETAELLRFDVEWYHYIQPMMQVLQAVLFARYFRAVCCMVCVCDILAELYLCMKMDKKEKKRTRSPSHGPQFSN